MYEHHNIRWCAARRSAASPRRETRAFVAAAEEAMDRQQRFTGAVFGYSTVPYPVTTVVRSMAARRA